MEELERILSNANYVRYKLLVERQNSPLEGQIYTKDDILVEIDIEDERYNFYDSKSSDFEEFVESDGTVQTFFGQGYSRLVRGNREYYGYLTGDSNSGDISLERVVNESQIEGYYEFPETILPQMQVNHVEFYIEVIDFIKKEVKPDEISEEVLNISGIDYEVYKIPFEYKYTSFDTDQQLIEDLFRATIYVDKNTKLPVRIEDKRDLTQGAVEIITTDLVEVEYELYSDTELAEIFALDFDPDKIKPYDPYILDIEEVKFEGVILSGNSGEVFNTPKFSTNGKTYKIKSQKYYDPFINLPTILGKFLQGREVIVNGYVSGDNFILIEFELVRRSGK